MRVPGDVYQSLGQWVPVKDELQMWVCFEKMAVATFLFNVCFYYLTIYLSVDLSVCC